MHYSCNKNQAKKMNKFTTQINKKLKNRFQSQIEYIDKRSKKMNKFTSQINKNIKSRFQSQIEYIDKKRLILSKIYLDDVKPKIEKASSQIHRPNIIETLQNQVEKFLKNDSDNVALKQSLFWAKSITWVLIGTTGFAISWISLAKTDEIVIAIGKLEPKSGIIDVQMPLEGITSQVLVKEGEEVKKGQVLIKLDTEITAARNESLQKNLEINETIMKKYENLVTEGAITEIQYLMQKERVQELKSEVKTNQVRMKYQEILSPADGKVFELKPKGPGYVAQTSQPVLQIIPTGNLIAKVEIQSRTIGFVETGKKADISIDSFPASDFGVVEGVVETIGSDALPPNPAEGKGYRFPATIILETQYLKLKTGKKLKLQPGMSLNANIKLRKVTYIQLLLNKFGDKSASLKSI